ncbi:MAG: SDR family NAD(P)-dependent oxidoreductase [Sandaracinaceae bacterium]|nr:SDR family NAD(P)-dependent oxidoreductase [Sandaracinaceae bacterium]
MKLSEKVAWVTGASSGIGEALVPVLLARGARVVVSARRGDKLYALVQAHGAARVAAVPVDLNELASLDDAVRRAEAAFGRVDALINNAGRSQRAAALDTSMDDVRSLMDLNFMAPVALTRALAPAMVARGVGHVSVVSSVAGYVSTPHRSTYSASKFAVRGYFDSLRAELHGTGVEVAVICPGYVRTDITRAALGEGGAAHGKTSEAIESGLAPDRVAAAIADAIESGRHELVIGGKETAGVYLARFAPSLVRRLAPRFTPD